MNSVQISESVRTQSTPQMYNALVKDVSHLIAIAGSGKTIATGAITVAPVNGEGFYVVTNESGAATDDLDTINGGASGDVIALLMTAGQVATLKNGSGNIKTPGAVDFSLSETLVTLLRYNGSNWYVMGGGAASGDQPTAGAMLDLTNTYQDLVAAPVSGIRLVTEITFTNEDATVTTSFFFKIVRSGTDYFTFELQLAPGDSLTLIFPFRLATTDKIQAKVGATCTGRAYAGYLISTGGMGVANFTGTAWADVLTVAAGKKYSLTGIAVQNSYTTTQTMQVQIIDASSNTKLTKKRSIPPGATWVFETKFVISAGYKVQAKHGAASCTGSALASYLEV